MNLNLDRGMVGKYHGNPVYVTTPKEYDTCRKQRNVIYALSFGMHENLIMVQDGWEIGHMTPEGEAVLLDEGIKYVPFAEKVMQVLNNTYTETPVEEEKEEPVLEEVQEVVPEPQEKVSDIDLLTLSERVDDFLYNSMNYVLYENLMFNDSNLVGNTTE